jgi:Ca2+-binding RTX toxin-like protein
MAANTAQGLDVAGGGTDTISNFENAVGSIQSDNLYGNAGANTFDGNGGDDFLFSFAGNDVLDGGAGNDLIFGGAGKDVLSGGTGNDTFLFTNATDTGKTAATRDHITDFNTNSAGNDADVLNFSLMDADPTAPGNQAFVFDGPNVNFTGTHGELRDYVTATGYIVDGDLNGDKIAVFSIAIDDPTHAIVWHAATSMSAGIDILL